MMLLNSMKAFDKVTEYQITVSVKITVLIALRHLATAWQNIPYAGCFTFQMYIKYIFLFFPSRNSIVCIKVSESLVFDKAE